MPVAKLQNREHLPVVSHTAYEKLDSVAAPTIDEFVEEKGANLSTLIAAYISSVH
jgi:hypothetical protein